MLFLYDKTYICTITSSLIILFYILQNLLILATVTKKIMGMTAEIVAGALKPISNVRLKNFFSELQNYK